MSLRVRCDPKVAAGWRRGVIAVMSQSNGRSGFPEHQVAMDNENGGQQPAGTRTAEYAAWQPRSRNGSDSVRRRPMVRAGSLFCKCRAGSGQTD